MNINIKPYTVKSPEGMLKQDVISNANKKKKN